MGSNLQRTIFKTAPYTFDSAIMDSLITIFSIVAATMFVVSALVVYCFLVRKFRKKEEIPTPSE